MYLDIFLIVVMLISGLLAMVRGFMREVLSIVAWVAAAGAAFYLFPDKILDSRIGALDRSLGFLFGLARGLIIVVVAFVFFNWLVPQKSQPEAIKNARSRVVLQGTGDWLESLLPENLDTYITNILKKKPKGDEQDEPPPDQRGEMPTAAPHWS